MKHIIRTIILIGLVSAGISSALLPSSAHADVSDACDKYTSGAKNACERGYSSDVACGTLGGNATACDAGRDQAIKDGKTTGGGGGTTTPPGNGGGEGECGGAKTEIVNCDEGAGLGAIASLIKTAIMIVTVIIGIVAVGGISYAAIIYASARDSQSQVSEAMTIIRNIVIGLLLYGFTVAIINWLIPGGVIG